MKLSEEMLATLECYNKGLSLYKIKNFSEAILEFKKALTYKHDDGPSLLYIDRCNNFINNPPPADWDGVYTMTTK